MATPLQQGNPKQNKHGVALLYEMPSSIIKIIQQLPLQTTCQLYSIYMLIMVDTFLDAFSAQFSNYVSLGFS